MQGCPLTSTCMCTHRRMCTWTHPCTLTQILEKTAHLRKYTKGKDVSKIVIKKKKTKANLVFPVSQLE